MFTSARQYFPTLLPFVSILHYRKKIMEPYPGGPQSLFWNHLTPALKISVSPEGKKNEELLQPCPQAYFPPWSCKTTRYFLGLGEHILRTLGWRVPFAWQSNKVALFYSKALSPCFCFAQVNKIQLFSNNNQQNIDLPSLFTPVRPLSTCVGLGTALPHWTVAILCSPH